MQWYFVLSIIIIGILLLLLIIYLIIGRVLAKFIANPHRYTKEEQDEYNKKMGYDQGIESMEETPIDFVMKDNYVIHGEYNLVPYSNVYCILSHGHGSSRDGARKYALIFKELGISTIIYDLRSHGLNSRKPPVTMGYQESKDLSEIIRLTYKKFGMGIDLGLQGVSMGAATSIEVLKYNQNLSFVIEDCGYSDIKNVVGDVISKKHLSKKLFLPVVNLNLKLFYKFSFKDAKPVDSLKNNEVPILFIHGTKDNYVLPYNCEELLNVGDFKKEIKYFADATHASSIFKDRSLYQETIKDFLIDIQVF